MAIYTNVVQEFRKEIEANLNLNDVIDTLIANRIIDEKLYFEIWANQNDRLSYLLDSIVKNGKLCAKFIDVLGTISRLKPISEIIKASIDRIKRTIVLGGFPEFSLNYVVRNSVANAIQQEALNLDPQICSTLVVHGLPGFGKSCLVNQVLQTKRFLDVSGGAMFWINLGEHMDTTNVLNPMWNLYLTAVKQTDQIALAHRPDDVTVLRDELRRIFLDEPLKDSYIILDDVKSPEVLEIFKLRCKLIVTTQDKNIANDSEAVFIKVTTGFTKKESLELLRKSLNTDHLSDKEEFADKIHNLCDGCPMLLNIIGSILKDSRDESLSTDLIWRSIIAEIEMNDYLSHPITTNVIAMIQKFVTCLNPDVQTCFHSLAVFPKHVNIRPEILTKLWNRNYYAVRQVMIELEKKSLVVSFFNKDLKLYIYSIHSLVRSYLVEKQSAEDIESYHKQMITQCEDILCKSPPDDPIANYIFGYYGHHAKNAKLYDKFEKYFDLQFIENKIKRVGSADLLTDFESYREFITKKQRRLERKLNDYIKFVHCYSAHLHISPETNIVQFAFFNDNTCVYEEAKKIAANNRDQLYIKLDPYSDRHKNFPVLKLSNTATSACFKDLKEVLVGTSSGTIEVKSFHQYQRKVHHFEGHSDQITSLQLSPDNKSFLSISRDHTVRLWRFIDDLDPQSPKLKQTNWKNLHSPDESAESHKTFKMHDSDYITSAAFPFDNSDEIVTASQRGKVVRWNAKTAGVIKEASPLGLAILKIAYVHDSQQVIFSYDSNKVYVYQRGNLVYNGQFGTLDDITDLVLIPNYCDFKEVAVTSGKRFEVWEYASKTRRFYFDTFSKITAVAINNNSDYLVVGTVNFIYLYNYKTQKIFHHNNDFGPPSSLYVLPDRVVFINLDKDNVQRCEIYLEPSRKPIVHDLSLFSCHWKDSLPIYFIVNKENKIDIFNGHSIILSGIDDIGENIKCGSFSLCGRYVILGTETGKVYFYHYKKGELNCVSVGNSEISLIKSFEIDFLNAELYSCLYGIVVVATRKSVVVIVDNEIKKTLDVATPIFDVFYLRKCLIAIDVDGGVSLCSIFEDQATCWVSTEYKNVTGATTFRNNLFAIASSHLNGHKVTVLSVSSSLAIQNVFEHKLNSKPKCLCFSSTGKVLSVGCESGDIQVFNLENDMGDVMSLHKRAVERMVFAPNVEPILVSLGDQIAWWNLSSFQDIKEKNSPGSGDVTNQLQIFTFDNWKDKKLHDTVPYLLTSTNLHGKQLRYISASKDFRSFLIIDCDGNIFKMDIINS